MGYYTNYKMEILDLKGNILFEINEESEIDDALEYDNGYEEGLVEVLREIKTHDDDFYGLLSEGSCKWYDHEPYLNRLSKDFKQFVFLLYGEGEEQGDVWRKYFYNGKVKKIVPKLHWPKFDVEKFME